MRPGISAAALKQLADRLVAASAPVQKRVFHRAMTLSPAVQRRLAGRPVVVDGQTLAVDTQLMLRLMKLSGQPDAWLLPLPQARAALTQQSVLGGGVGHRVGAVDRVRTPAGPARLYVPTQAPATGPLLLFLHGGGFALGDLDSHDAPCRVLAEETGVRVLSLDYRLAPEAPFPAGCDDAAAAFDWVVEHAAELGADPSRIGVGGDSAGGNLAAGVALAAGVRCAFQLLLYPVTQFEGTTRSRELFDTGFFLTGEAISTVGAYYVAAGTDPHDPRLSPLDAEIPSGTAPAYVATAGFDPLRDEGEAYAARLREAGVDVQLTRFEDQIHGFVNVLSARSSRAAVSEIAAALKAGL